MSFHPWFSSVAALAIGVLAGCEQAPPSQSRDAPTYSFGTAEGGTKLLHTFTIDNPGGSDVTVTSVDSDCGCTVVGDIPKTIPARRAIDIPVEVLLPEIDQAFKSQVLVTLSNGRLVLCTVTGDVVSPLPKAVSFGRFKRDENVQRSFELRPADRAVHVVNVEHDRDLISVDHRVLPSGGVRFDVSPRSPPPGRFSTLVRITTDDERQPLRTVEVSGHMLRPVELDRESLSFGVVPSSRTKTLEILGRSPYGARLRVVSATPDDQGLVSVDSGAIADGGDVFRIPVTIRGELPTEIIRRAVRVEVGDDAGNVTRFDVPVYAIRQQPLAQ